MRHEPYEEGSRPLIGPKEDIIEKSISNNNETVSDNWRGFRLQPDLTDKSNR